LDKKIINFRCVFSQAHSQKYFSSKVDNAAPKAIKGDKGLLKSILKVLALALPNIMVSSYGGFSSFSLGSTAVYCSDTDFSRMKFFTEAIPTLPLKLSEYPLISGLYDGFLFSKTVICWRLWGFW
jgi:hypothetical protein